MRLVWTTLVALALSVGIAAEGRAQIELSARGPRFLAANSAGAAPVDASDATVLRRRVSLSLDGQPLEAALRDIARQADLELMFTEVVLPKARRVTLHARDITVAGALTEVLLDTGVDVLLLPNGQMGLVPRSPRAARTGSVAGRVTNAETGEGIAGVELRVAGTQLVATTGTGGEYVLRAIPAGEQRVTARQIGYRPQTQMVTVVDGQAATLDFALVVQPTQLDEVVTTVTGEQRLRELGHVVGRINADSLVKEAPVSSLSELLNGRVPGLQVFQSQGTVGGQVKLQIRGANSLLLNTEPIVIIDGVRYTNGVAPPPFTSGPNNVEPTSPLNDINPNDIESIEVVKGPSAATLYGTDAANGVLVITTKRGRPGPARWNVYAKGTNSEISAQRYPDLYWGWQTVDGVPSATDNCHLGLVASGTCVQDSVTVLPNPLNDPQYTLFGGAPRWEYGTNVAGGRQDLRYYFSGDYEDATGPLQLPLAIAEQLEEQRGLSEVPEEWREPNAMTKLNLRANVTAVLGETADLRVNTGYVHNATRSLALGFRNSYATGAFSGNPTAPYGGRFDRSADPAEAFAQTSTERTDRFFGSASGQWRPLAWLTARATVGLDLSSRNRYSLARRGDSPHAYPNGSVQDDRVRQLATTAELGATATARWGRLSARTAVGAQYVRNLNDALWAFGANLPPGGTSVGEAVTVVTRQTYGETATLGSYLEETIGLNDRLFLTGALRADGASTFGQDYDVAVYPKVSASWLVSDEPFLPRLPGLDELRLRYAFGASGQQPLPSMTLPQFGSGTAIENGAPVPTVLRRGLGSPELRPERVREHEFGFDATVLQNRVQLGLTWYRRRTVDQVVAIQLPPGFGIMLSSASHFTNLGLTTQRGFEAELTARVLDTRLLSWDLTLQHSVHRTQLVDIGDGLARESRSVNGGWVEGYPLGARFHRSLLGYTDTNGDGIIVFDELQVGDTAVYMGESTPPKSQTLTTVVGLFERRLRLSALLERRTDFTQVNQLSTTQCERFTCQAQVDPSAPLAKQAQALYSAPFVVGTAPESGDFTRLREVTAALDLPVGLARALRLRSATLAVSARNLALWTDFRGPDPESAALSGIVGGVADGIPQGRSWTVRLDLGL